MDQPTAKLYQSETKNRQKMLKKEKQLKTTRMLMLLTSLVKCIMQEMKKQNPLQDAFADFLISKKYTHKEYTNES